MAFLDPKIKPKTRLKPDISNPTEPDICLPDTSLPCILFGDDFSKLFFDNDFHSNKQFGRLNIFSGVCHSIHLI